MAEPLYSDSTMSGIPPDVAIDVLEGHVMMGGVVSELLTVNEHDDWIPARSVAVQRTVVTPGLKKNPVALRMASCTPQLMVTSVLSSVAVTEALTRTRGVPPEAKTVIGAGQVMMGATLSMRIVKDGQTAVETTAKFAALATRLEMEYEVVAVLSMARLGVYTALATQESDADGPVTRLVALTWSKLKPLIQ
jgi:hypothetical protein